MAGHLLRSLLMGEAPAEAQVPDENVMERICMGGYCVIALAAEPGAADAPADGERTAAVLDELCRTSGEERRRLVSLAGENGLFYVLVSYQSRRDFEMKPAMRTAAQLQEGLARQGEGTFACGVGGFCLFYEMIPFSRREAEIALEGRAVSKTVRNILRIVDENFADPELSNGVIAKASFLNYSYMCTQFHTEMGVTLNQYIRIYRMRRALQNLEEPGASIQASALRVGYDDSKYFSKCFKREFHMTPGRYQRRAADHI